MYRSYSANVLAEAIESRIHLSAQDSWLYAIDSGASDQSSTLFRIDVKTGKTATVGETHVEGMTDIAFVGGTQLFGVTSTDLYLINSANAEAERVGSLGVSGINALIGTASKRLLAAMSQDGGYFLIDPVTGQASRVGELGDGLTSQGDLSLGPDGVFFGTVTGKDKSSQLVEVDPELGIATPRATIPFDGLFGLETSPDGELYASTASDRSAAKSLIRIDPVAKTTTKVADLEITDTISGFAMRPFQLEGDRRLLVNGTLNAERIDIRLVETHYHLTINGSSEFIAIADAVDSIEVNAGAGNDIIVVISPKTGALINAGAGNDRIYATDGDDVIYAGTGKDTVRGGDGDDLIRGNSHNDLVYAGLGADTVYGDAGSDVLHGEQGDDNIRGGEGNDKADGGDGIDRVYGDAGVDRLTGGRGADRLLGGDGNDTFFSLDHEIDTLTGGNGKDLIAESDPIDQLSL